MASINNIFLGDILFHDVDQPDNLALPEKLNDSIDVLSDGTRRIDIAGYTTSDITFAGTMTTSAGGSPLARLERLRSLFRLGQPVAFRYRNFTYRVVIREITPTLLSRDFVQYALTLFVGQVGALPRGADALPSGSSGARAAARAGSDVQAAVRVAAGGRPDRMP